MGVRKTESRIPVGLQPTDLGEAVTSSNGHATLVSFITAPLTIQRENTYVVFVTDAALASSVQSFEWSFIENANAPIVKTTDFGEANYTPLTQGSLQLTVRLLGAGSAELAKLSLVQHVAPLNAELETMILDATNMPGAGIGNPEVLRELINDHNPYYLNVKLQTAESGEGFKKFLFNTINDGALQRSVTERRYHLSQVAASLNSGEADYISSIAPGLGVASVRLSLTAIMLPPNSISFVELPSPPAENAVADEQIRQKLAALSEEVHIDLFNLVRFPKTNISMCGKLLESLRNKFFSGVNFDDVLTKMSGAMGEWIILNYNKGPLHRH